MDLEERKRILGEWGVGYETPRSRSERQVLERDLEGSPFAGRPLRRRVANFRVDADRYVASLGGPLPYMVRLRTIEAETEGHEQQLELTWRELAAKCSEDPERFSRSWRRIAERWDFRAVNELIETHNRYYPVEARLPMDVRTGDFVLVNGRPYRRPLLAAVWALDRFPTLLALTRE